MTDSDSSYFPPELLGEILLKLSAKSLIQFTVVSKLWHSLITSFSFVSAHVAQSPHTNILFTWPYINTDNGKPYWLFQDSKNRPFSLDFISELNFPFNRKLGFFRLVGSCNGVLCLSDDFLGELQSLVLWNPSIQKLVALPLPSIRPQSPHMFVLGFGADLPETGDYKLVRFVYRKNGIGYSDAPEIEIYSINSGVWRRVMGVEIKHRMVEFMWSQSFVNGAIWIAYDVVVNGGGFRSLVVSFSIADEVFGEIMLPDALVGVIPMNLSIMLFEESLAIVKYGWETNGASCEVWVMKQYGVLESWSRLYCINLVPGMGKVVGFRNNREVLFSAWRDDLVSYDPNNGQHRYLGIQGSSRSFYVQNYMESLSLLKGNNVILRMGGYGLNE